MRDPWTELSRSRYRRRRARPGWLSTVLSLGAALVLVGSLAALVSGLAASDRGEAGPAGADAAIEALRAELDDARGRLAVAEARLERMVAIERYSTLYRIPAGLAADIYDIALAEGIHPSLGFQLVKVESGFRAGVRSEKGAIGYTQIRLPTARIYQPDIIEAGLLDRTTNLRLGFRFLKDLLEQYHQDLHLALVAYNRGPTRVNELRSRGEDPANGYAEAVLRGVRKG